MGVPSILYNLTIYYILIYNPGPEYPKGWYLYIGMTRKELIERINQHITEQKSNIKFETIRAQSDPNKWEYGTIKHFKKQFKNKDDAMKWLGQIEQYYIKFYNTYKGLYGLNGSVGGEYDEGRPNRSGIKGFYYEKIKNVWVFKHNGKDICSNKDLELLILQVKYQYGYEIEILDQEKYERSIETSRIHKYKIKRKYWWTGSNFLIKRNNKTDYIWSRSEGMRPYANAVNGTVNKQKACKDTIELIEKHGDEIYAKQLFAYWAVIYEKKLFINAKDKTLADELHFMRYEEFCEKYPIHTNEDIIELINTIRN